MRDVGRRSYSRFRRASRLMVLALLLPLAPLALIPSAAAAATLVPGTLTNVASGGKCLTDPNSNAGTVQLVVTTCINGSSTQAWQTLAPAASWANDSGDPSPVFKNVYSGLCLDLDGNNPSDSGVPAWQYPCSFSDEAESMTIIFNNQPPTSGPNELQNDHGTCLDDKNGGTANNNPVWFYQCNYTAAQQWDFIVDKGQQLALHDIDGKVNSVKLEGINQSCNSVQKTVNFPNPYVDISGWYWTTYCGYPGHATGVAVYMYSGANLSGTYLGYVFLEIPDWQTNTTWYTCQIDGGSNSYPGVNTV
jgi:Ricin-type beta-trefoil lectin domain